VFALGKEEYWNKTTLPWTITYTNIGGMVEPGESMLAATKREAFEESGCKVKIIPAPQTLHCILEERIYTSYQLKDEYPPILIYNTTNLSVCVYVAKCNTPPTPQREVPALLFLPPSILQGGLLRDILQAGGILKEQIKESIPQNVNLHPWGSADLLASDFNRFRTIMGF
jgi:8-oxo-dGTP pyrophosphatase MutT (NUDIX family)